MIDTEPLPDATPDPSSRRRILPDEEAFRLYDRWKDLLPKLIHPLRQYRKAVFRTPIEQELLDAHKCQDPSCSTNTASILCLFWDRLFPTSPSQPRMVVSIALLDFYFALFERSGDAVTALAGALRNFYACRGWHMLDDKGQPIRDPFRRGLGYAIQWYDALSTKVSRKLEEIVNNARGTVRDDELSLRPPGAGPYEECASLLQRRCPACFSGMTFGRSEHEGYDIQLPVDGNFSQRHLRSAGDSPWFYEPEYFISKVQVDSMGALIDAQRKKPPSRSYVPKVPNEAVDSCERGHDAADEHKTKTNKDIFDDTGVMALVCRHDVPIFLANIDTPGEQQKYALALISHLFAYLPARALIRVLYDVACVVERSIELYNLLPDNISSRISWSTSAMHAYGHEWSCQLVYNPRMSLGLGLTDGEGTERFWSRSRKLIPITRTSVRSRRIWLLDRQAGAIGDELRDDLGDFLKRRLSRGVQRQGEEAKRTLEECGIPLPELRRQWEMQRAAQLSIRAHAPAQLKKELDVVLTLQAEIDDLERALSTAQTNLAKAAAPETSLVILQQLISTHSKLMSHAEALYASLNITDSFPHLQGVNYDFVRLLILARDLKMNIRKRAIASFLEWDRLDQAVGGHDNPLGTKLHQQTRKTMSKRRPALLGAIRKFNKYCDALQQLHKLEWRVPVPSKLSTDLSTLKDDPILLQDVWIEPCDVDPPRWLYDSNVRVGIRAMLKIDRCREERRRLGIEADNLGRWFGRELAALELALRLPENVEYVSELQHRLQDTRLLRQRWASPLMSTTIFDYHLSSSINTALRLSGQSTTAQYHWMPPLIQLSDTDLAAIEVLTDAVDNDEDVDIPASVAEDPSHVLLADILAGGADDDDDGLPPDSELGAHNCCERRTLIGHISGDRSPLNDECVNGCAALLFTDLVPQDERNHIAVFSTLILSLVRQQVPDEELWKYTRRYRYWERGIWVIPIFRPGPRGCIGHWTLGIVNHAFQYIFHFDSLAAQDVWQDDTEHIMEMLRRLSNAASMNLRMDGWTCHPISSTQLQHNSYDCGVWILACMAAIFRGYDATGMQEHQVPVFRRYLSNLVLTLALK
ncbi:hypothetical protein OE88DRAFT_1624486 [Heliocybe sulcata]|uniref:Ubiquitin-like protease family profile domain-containing protein n=1 Tax=Heliocybe sulcata TaxID=5364 RepID=A0A5C3N9U5_9AGAM|nr:hypothetical protein OE88DRAFT_1624486 [Heliocybe sulcata]